MIKTIIALIFAIPTYGLSILALVIYVFVKNRYFSQDAQFEQTRNGQPTGGLIKLGDEYYIEKLARLENQLRHNDDFYGHWLDTERAELLADTRFAIPNVILGLIYMNGIHVDSDIEKAERYFTASIKLGSPFGYKYLGAIESRQGNRAKGNEYIEKAVSLGDPEAMVMLGFYYVHEITLEGGQPDYKRARGLFKKAARMGHAAAIQNIELMNQRGV